MADEKQPNPTMLYKPGDTVNPEAWNRKLDTQVVDGNDDKAVSAAQKAGWLTADDLAKADAKAEPAPAA